MVHKYDHDRHGRHREHPCQFAEFAEPVAVKIYVVGAAASVSPIESIHVMDLCMPIAAFLASSAAGLPPWIWA
jgi:hypothetical protein